MDDLTQEVYDLRGRVANLEQWRDEFMRVAWNDLKSDVKDLKKQQTYMLVMLAVTMLVSCPKFVEVLISFFK